MITIPDFNNVTLDQVMDANEVLDEIEAAEIRLRKQAEKRHESC
jgi:hypothetical protein